MAHRKTKTLLGSYLRYRLDDLEKRVRRQMRGVQEAAPAELRNAIGLLVVCHDAPEVFLDTSRGAERLRLELVRFLTRFPEHAMAGLRSVYRKPKSDATASAIVREFLLTESTIERSGGKRISVVGAKDSEIAHAAAVHYKKETGRNSKITSAVVKDERRRLERKYAKPVAIFANFLARLDEVLYPWAYQSRGRRKRCLEFIEQHYTAYVP